MDMIISYGDKLVVWLAALLLAAVTAWVLKNIKNKTAQGIVSRAIDEVGDAVAAVYQRFVSALKAEGKFNKEAAGRAFDQAMAEAKSNIGTKGLKALARVVGVDVDSWLGTKLEASVAASKPILSPPKAPGGASAASPPPQR